MAEVKKKKKCKSKRKDSEMKDQSSVGEEEATSGSEKIAGKHKHKKKNDVKMTLQDQEIQFAVTVGKKKHKKKLKHAHSDGGGSDDRVEETPILKKKKKHKKKKKQTDLIEVEKNAESRESGHESTLGVELADTERSKKKHRKHALRSTESSEGESREECTQECTQECTRRKKKHKKRVTEEPETDIKTHKLNAGNKCSGEGEEINSEHCNANKKKNKKRMQDESLNETEHIKKCKRSHENVDLDCSSSSTQTASSEGKRKKKRKGEHSPASIQLEVAPTESDVKKSKKEKKHKRCDKDEKLLGACLPNGDAEIKVASPDRDDTVVRGVNGSPATKQTNSTTLNGANSRFLGQWGTAELATDDRQNKFFRLLGGLKASSGQKAATGGRFNSALTADKETLLNKTLETQFDSALSYIVNKQRSGGLGYTAPPEENKKFYIDRTSSKSFKFND